MQWSAKRAQRAVAPVDHHVVAGRPLTSLAWPSPSSSSARTGVQSSTGYSNAVWVDPDALAEMTGVRRGMPRPSSRLHRRWTGRCRSSGSRPSGRRRRLHRAPVLRCCRIAWAPANGTLVLGPQVGELGQARDRRRQRRQHADADERVSPFRGSGDPRGGSSSSAPRPGSDGDVGQHRVGRVAHPTCRSPDP